MNELKKCHFYKDDSIKGGENAEISSWRDEEHMREMWKCKNCITELVILFQTL